MEIAEDIDDLGFVVGTVDVALGNRRHAGEVVEPGVGVTRCRQTRPHSHLPGEPGITHAGHEDFSYIGVVKK